MPKQDKQYPCDRSVEEAIDDLIFILPYADKFVDELNFLSMYAQEDQLDEITTALNNLVEWDCHYYDWPQRMRIDLRLRDMIDAMQELKVVRNTYLHNSTKITAEEKIDLLGRLYEHGHDINWKIKRAIDLMQSDEFDL